MKNLVKVLSTAYFILGYKAFLLAEEFQIDAATSNQLFGEDHKIAKGMMSAEWLVKGGAGIFAITCFISSGNAARGGQYGRATGAFIGGLIAAMASYLVSFSQG